MTPDITPDSPVAVLWQERDGGLNGGRARSRLRTAGIHTVGELTAMSADDIRDIPRARESVLAEIRLALALAGLHLAGDPAPSPAVIEDARRWAETLAQPGPATLAGPPPPVSREEFTALVKDLRAELARADKDQRARLLDISKPETPDAFTGRGWAWQTVDAAGIETVTGYAPVSVRRYTAAARKAHAAGTADERTMPLPNADGRWVIGRLALYMATRNEAQAQHLVVDDETAAKILADVRAGRLAGDNGLLAKGERIKIAKRYGVSIPLVTKLAAGDVPQKDRKGTMEAREGPQKVRADDDQVAAFLAARIARERRYLNAKELLAEAREAGLPAAENQLARLLPGIRAAEARRTHKPSGPARARGESLRADGLQYAAELAEDWAVTREAIAKAVERVEIRWAKTEGRRKLYDPRRLRARTDRRRTPVDVSHPLARLEPGDPGYEEGQGR